MVLVLGNLRHDHGEEQVVLDQVLLEAHQLGLVSGRGLQTQIGGGEGGAGGRADGQPGVECTGDADALIVSVLLVHALHQILVQVGQVVQLHPLLSAEPVDLPVQLVGPMREKWLHGSQGEHGTSRLGGPGLGVEVEAGVREPAASADLVQPGQLVWPQGPSVHPQHGIADDVMLHPAHGDIERDRQRVLELLLRVEGV